MVWARLTPWAAGSSASLPGTRSSPRPGLCHLFGSVASSLRRGAPGSQVRSDLVGLVGRQRTSAGRGRDCWSSSSLGRTGNPTHFPTASAFAQYACTAPIEIASADRARHRLARRGDRQLNLALHTVDITQIRMPGVRVHG
ncbi:transposase [Streptomyces sp. NPDC049541]|uniref:transposase n=1 Tax=Streptomyces sp. NPDC049541 TaxID=3365594 RepID=UPI0037A4C432